MSVLIFEVNVKKLNTRFNAMYYTHASTDFGFTHIAFQTSPHIWL